MGMGYQFGTIIKTLVFDINKIMLSKFQNLDIKQLLYVKF